MVHSIRWRLVASFVFVTLLTVSLIGIVALSLIRQQTVQQEHDYLTANAEAVARQALPLMQPLLQQGSLQELARTSAFLSNARVRIVDAQQNVLADSGPGDQESDYVWLVADLGLRPGFGQRNAILGPYPGLPNFCLANGFSGHGLQHAPGVGMALAELILFGEYRTLRLDRLGFERFATGALVREENVV